MLAEGGGAPRSRSGEPDDGQPPVRAGTRRGRHRRPPRAGARGARTGAQQRGRRAEPGRARSVRQLFRGYTRKQWGLDLAELGPAWPHASRSGPATTTGTSPTGHPVHARRPARCTRPRANDSVGRPTPTRALLHRLRAHRGPTALRHDRRPAAPRRLTPLVSPLRRSVWLDERSSPEPDASRFLRPPDASGNSFRVGRGFITLRRTLYLSPNRRRRASRDRTSVRDFERLAQRRQAGMVRLQAGAGRSSTPVWR